MSMADVSIIQLHPLLVTISCAAGWFLRPILAMQPAPTGTPAEPAD